MIENYGGYVPAGTTGRRKMKCFSPDHNDNVASASVDFSNNRYMCFGCDLSGDALDLIVVLEGVGVARAVEIAEGWTGSSGEKVQPEPGDGFSLFDL